MSKPKTNAWPEGVETRLRERLRALADCNNHEDVADLLRVAGVKGRRCVAGMCPVSNYLADADAGLTVGVYPREISWTLAGTGEIDSAPTSSAVLRFIADFDRGTDFQDLEAPEAS